MLLIFANLTFVNLKRLDWWFSLKTLDDKIEMYIFVVYYVGSLTLFVLGLKAPGLTHTRNYYNLNGDSSSSQNNLESERLMHTGSTWAGAAKKIKTLAPFLWPKKSALLKLQVIICILLLIIARVINLFVPISYLACWLLHLQILIENSLSKEINLF
ncbi:ATP-binding cassette sub-family B member 6, mitochondrial-like [Diaphorina citri]|uniref:ATP-binding cassette sub-family B member 6, mitochondrial-like n=1 Tax=Diaphorina citri TaxID=121845 RepID=A0A3Q0IX07_DIACI|nr:ATP-binding cassette sub-family B member 6, mitochondrial-like [Diaphorina citri]